MQRGTFSEARISLTLWYELFLFLIILAFSLALYTTETGNFAHVVVQRQFGGQIPRVISGSEFEELREQVVQLRETFIFDLAIIDLAILFVGGGLGYILAGKTLEPIHKTYEKQKEFLANASHEFRTPLAAIQTASEVALRGTAKTNEDYKTVIKQTLQESIRLGIMADELLMLSRIDAGIAILQLSSVNIAEIVTEAIGEIEPMMKNKHISFTKDIPERVIARVDKNRFKQLVLILLDNAVKFTPKDKHIHVSLTDGSKPTLSVSDTGIGIDKKDQLHIFDRFYQVDKVRGNDSAGLGLSIAKWIVSAHGGSITVVSKKNKGTTFTVSFPNSN